MNQSKKGLFLVILSSLIFGTVPGAITYCYEQGANQTVILVARYAILALVLLPSVFRLEHPLTVYKRHWWQLLCLSFFCTFTAIFLLSSYKYISTSAASALHFMYPLVVVLICALGFRDKISKLKLVCLALCLGGAVCTMDLSAGVNFLGAALALTSALMWGSYITGVDKFDFSDLPSRPMLFFIELGNLFFIIFFYAIPTGTLHADIAPIGWVAVVLSNLVAAVGGTLFFTIGIRYTDAQVAAIASTLEPITCIVIGVLLLGEPFTLRSLAGTVMILSAVVLLSVFDGKESI